ncbi:uncharacterized protein LOC143263581 [Megalopta genalis]|uniref:uncharacterized protein LOC143263581 n=1 Tax=Megalopta genalis TaxID=115081 RepID=UPI003FD52A72
MSNQTNNFLHKNGSHNDYKNYGYSISMKRSFQQSQPQSQQKQLQIPRNARILGRRYSIAGNYFKFLEICVRVDENLRVEFVLGDNRGTEISFSMATWKLLVKTRDYIHNYFDADKKEKQIDETLSLQIVNFNGMSLIKLFDSQASIYVTKETMDNLYKLELCMDHIYSWLSENIPEIQDRFAKLVDIVKNSNKEQNYATFLINVGSSSIQRYFPLNEKNYHMLFFNVRLNRSTMDAFIVLNVE